jgi:hypothetical protein
VLREDQLGFRRRKGTKNANGTLRISQCTLYIYKELCACCVDWHKIFYNVNYTK